MALEVSKRMFSTLFKQQVATGKRTLEPTDDDDDDDDDDVDDDDGGDRWYYIIRFVTFLLFKNSWNKEARKRKDGVDVGIVEKIHKLPFVYFDI